MLARFAEHWSPKTIAEINDYDVRIVKVRGEFTWHKHTDTDEFFLVLGGQLTIQTRDHDVVLGPRDCSSCLAGKHCPRFDIETALLLLEASRVVNTGDAGGGTNGRGRAAHLTCTGSVVAGQQSCRGMVRALRRFAQCDRMFVFSDFEPASLVRYRAEGVSIVCL